MSYVTETLGNLIHQTAFFNLSWGNLLMILVALVFLYLAIKKGTGAVRVARAVARRSFFIIKFNSSKKCEEGRLFNFFKTLSSPELTATFYSILEERVIQNRTRETSNNFLNFLN